MDAETRAYLDAMRAESRRDLTDAMAAMRTETRRDLAAAVTLMREETRRDLAAAVATMREETRGDLAAAMATLRAEMRAEGVETRRHFDVVAEGLQGDIRLVAEGAVANTEAIGRLRSDVARDMDERFRVVRLALADVRRDIRDLGARR